MRLMPLHELAIKAGAADLIVKPVTAEKILNAVQRVTAPEALSETELARAFDRISEWEEEVLRLIVAGESSREIAHKFVISVKTIEAHRSRIMDKTRADDVGHLVRL